MRRGGLFARGMAMAGAAVLLSMLGGCQSDRATYREINGIRFQVPAGYKTRNSRFPGVFVFNRQENNASALIQVYFEHRASGEPGSDLTQEQIKSFDIRQTGKRKATLAGHDGACIEYSVALVRNSSLAQAECSFGTELHTSFFGTPNKINDFYAFMQAAQPVKRNS